MNSSPKKETTFSNMSYIEQVLAYYTWCVRYRWLVPFLRGGEVPICIQRKTYNTHTYKNMHCT